MADKKEKVKLSQAIKNNTFIIKTAFKSAPGLCIMRMIMGVITGLNHGATIYLISEILNALDRGDSFDKIMWTIVALAGYMLAYQVFYSWHWKIYNPKRKLNFIRELHKRFFVKSAELDLACYDTPEFYNDFIYSMQNCDKSIMNTLDMFSDILRCLFASISVFGVVATVDPVIAFVILGFSVIAMVINILENSIWYKYEIVFNAIWRKDWYFQRFFSLSEFAKEIRLTKVAKNMKNEFERNKIEDRRLTIKQQKELLGLQALYSFIHIAEDIFIILFMAYHLMVTKNVLVGGFAITLTASYKIRGMFGEIQWRLAEMNKNSVFADKVRRFLQTESKIISGERELDTFESIEFRNVGFAYGDTKVLDDVSFKVEAGERIAFVGYNGAGKTTITKLIMRLYDVSEGEILINGINIKEYRLDMLRQKIGAVFQDYKVFAATVAENVLADIYTPDKESVVLDALADSTFGEKLESLPNGIFTELTREFSSEGTELSGGESQKIAIARVFAHNNELVIMDEPSSALDPIAEYNLNVGIDKNAKGKTVIFITHRLSTTRHVDRIYMLENGKIIESGSHEALVAQGGKYGEMFELQAKKYRANQSN